MAKRVYFAFHYQDVIDFRANVVRKHGALSDSEKSGFFDWSIWEEAKKDSPLAVKRMINRELQGTSVTAVLIGSFTYSRPWVRYEIMKSLERGNELLGIHINSVRGKDSKVKTRGPNPFEYLAVKPGLGSKIQSMESKNGTWINYSEVAPFNNVNLRSRIPPNGLKLSGLSEISVYDWVGNDGYNQFQNWIA